MLDNRRAIGHSALVLRMLSPTFAATDRPSFIVDAFGGWLSTEMDGFRWIKSRRVLARSALTQRHEVALQTSTWSRAGVGTWVSPRVSVFDDRLAKWRLADPSVSAFADAEIEPPCVYSSLLVNAVSSFVSVDLSGLPQPPELKGASQAEFVTYVADVVVPVLDAFNEAASLVAALPESWLSMIGAGTVEWALACGDADAATELIRRSIGQPLRAQQRLDERIGHFRHGWELAEQGLRPERQPPFGFEAFGWLASTHDLLTPDDLGAREPGRRWRRVISKR